MTDRTLSELAHASCTLASMIDATIEKAWALNDQIERADMASRKK